MANKYDLKTWNKIQMSNVAAAAVDGTSIGTGGVGTGDTIPLGKTRFLTYIKVNRSLIHATTISKDLMLRIASVTTTKPSHIQMVNGLKMMLPMAVVSANTITTGFKMLGMELEMRGSIEHPILSVAGGNAMGINVSGGVEVDVHAQYYDE